MRQVGSLNHTRWECKYHVVFIPKCRRKVLFGQIRRDLSDIFHSLARQKESLIEEGHLMQDHVHMMISIPPKYCTSSQAAGLNLTAVRNEASALSKYPLSI